MTNTTKRSRRSTHRAGRSLALQDVRISRPFPSEMTCDLTYAETFILDPGATVSSVNSFRSGSIFDPNLTGTGHQPMFHDQLALIYQRYEVLSSRAELIPLTATADFFYGIDFSVLPTDLASLSLDALVETGRVDLVRSAMNVLNYSPISKLYVARASYTPKMLGLRSGDDALGATFGTNPLQNGYFQAWAVGSYGKDPGAVSLQVKITYTVKVSQDLDPAQS
jgi:hypothetical protein